MQVLPILLSDSYKQFHHLMYPENISMLYSNFTPRKSRMKTEKAVFFGLQYYIKEYLIKQWNENFFEKPLEDVIAEYKRFHKHFSFTKVSTDHIENLHKLGYLPLLIKSLPEGSEVPMGVPFFTVRNTHPSFAWLVNFIETQLSTVLWDLITVSTISKQYREILDKYALETTGSTEGVQWQGHDFSMRGRSSIESSFNQAGHLLSFTGTDTIPAVLFLEKYYNANIETELIGSSVPATEHSVMTSYGKEEEITAFRRLLTQFPTGVLSVVSDSFDLWKVCTEYLPQLREEILARDGKLVIRPDSGDPVDIICGKNSNNKYGYYSSSTENLTRISNGISEPEWKGVIELLWDIFGGTINEQGYKVLNPHIGAIYGDSITLERADEICKRLRTKGFASTNIVLGIGSYTFNMNTRDTLGMAMKATYCEILKPGLKSVLDEQGNFIGEVDTLETERRNIYKDPITDSGEKKSAKGLLMVYTEDGQFKLKQECSWEEESQGELLSIFKDGVLLKEYSLQDIRKKLNG